MVQPPFTVLDPVDLVIHPLAHAMAQQSHIIVKDRVARVLSRCNPVRTIAPMLPIGVKHEFFSCLKISRIPMFNSLFSGLAPLEPMTPLYRGSTVSRVVHCHPALVNVYFLHTPLKS